MAQAQRAFLHARRRAPTRSALFDRGYERQQVIHADGPPRPIPRPRSLRCVVRPHSPPRASEPKAHARHGFPRVPGYTRPALARRRQERRFDESASCAHLARAAR